MNISLETSERDVETKILKPLFTDTLGYPEDNVHFDVAVSLTFGREKKTKKADLVAYYDNKPIVVVEAKRPTETLQSGIDQVDSYAFALGSPYGIVTNGKDFVLRGYYAMNSRINIVEQTIEDLKQDEWRKLKELISFTNVLTTSSAKANDLVKPDEGKIKDYRRFFKTIHNVIRDNDKLDPGASFDEMSKILFLKVAEARWKKKQGDVHTLSVLTAERIDEWERLGGGQGMEYVNKWFSQAAREFFPDVFEENTKLNLSADTTKQVLHLMRSFDPTEGDVDVKGRAFEEFLPTQLRGKGLGQFFTPRAVVKFMVELAEISIHDKVVDFACGSGGFLINAFERMQSLTEQLPDGTWKRLGVDKADFMDDVRGQLYGIDAEPRAARTAKMNMLMWGDGDNIVRGNALDVKDFNGHTYKPTEYEESDKDSGCTVILANPPFGSTEKKQEILSRYELGSKYIHRKSQKTEILFLEKGVKLLRPQGKMLIVIPQGVLSNGSYEYVRDYLHSEVEVRAIVSLPTFSFVQSGVQTVKTCVLYVQKFTKEKKQLYDEMAQGKTKTEIRQILKSDPAFNYSFFMGTAEFLGYEPNGRPNVKGQEKTDLDLLREDFSLQYLLSRPHIDVVKYATAHYGEKPQRRSEQIMRGSQRGLKTSFSMDFAEAEDRLDPLYYLLKYSAGEKLTSFLPLSESTKLHSERFMPRVDRELDNEYPILSVTNDGKVSLNEYVKGEDFTQSYKRVSAGDIVYNPYRINIGSIGIVPKEYDGAFVSPAYVVFKSEGHNPQFLLNLLRSPFYKMYIDTVSTGSIRDSLSFDLMSTLRVPKVEASTQKAINEELASLEKLISSKQMEIESAKEKVISDVHALLNF